MDHRLVKVFLSHESRYHFDVRNLVCYVLIERVSPTECFKQVYPFLNLVHFSKVAWQVLAYAIFTEENRCSIVEDISSHFVHVAYQLKNKGFVGPDQLNLQDFDVLCESLTVVLVVFNHKKQDFQDLIVQIVEFFSRDLVADVFVTC